MKKTTCLQCGQPIKDNAVCFREDEQGHVCEDCWIEQLNGVEYCGCGAELCELGREYGVCQDCK